MKKSLLHFMSEVENPLPTPAGEEPAPEKDVEVVEGDGEAVETTLSDFKVLAKEFKTKVLSLQELELDNEGRVMKVIEDIEDLIGEIKAGLETKFYKLNKLNKINKKVKT